jgi:hypothetical protein
MLMRHSMIVPVSLPDSDRVTLSGF